MDQTQDLLGKDFYRYVQLYQAPDFVKTATLEDLCGDSSMHPDVFGDPYRRFYPCHSPAATWTSLAYLLDKAASPDPGLSPGMQKEAADYAAKAQLRITACGHIHGIDAELKQLQEKVAAYTADAHNEDCLSDDDFAIIYHGESGRERHYPLRNGKEVKEAADYLLRYRDRFPFELRQQFADRILVKQAALGVKLPDDVQETLEKQAGRGAGLAKSAAHMILHRVKMASMRPRRDDNVLREMLVLAEKIALHPSQLRSPGARCKVASVVDTFDRTHELTSYSEAFPRPEDVLFELTREKMASCVREHVGLGTGSIYKMADLERIPMGELRGLFGDAFSDQLTSDGLHVDSEKAAAFLPGLSTGDANMFDRFLYQTGIKPVLNEVTARSTAISNEFLQRIRQSTQTG
jgi:hypothetical protein